MLSPYGFIGRMAAVSSTGERVGRAVHGARRREHEPTHTASGHRTEDAERAPDVVIEIATGIGDRVLDRLERSEMDDGIDAMAPEGGRDEVAVAHVADDQRQRVDRGRVAAAQVIDDHDRMTGVGQMAGGQGADIAGTTRDQDAHRGVRTVARQAFGLGSLRRRGVRRVGLLGRGAGSIERNGSGSTGRSGSGSIRTSRSG